MLSGIDGSLLSIPFEEKFTHSSIAIHCIANKARKFSLKFGLSLELLIRRFQLLTLAGLLMQSFSANASIPERLAKPPGSRDIRSFSLKHKA